MQKFQTNWAGMLVKWTSMLGCGGGIPRERVLQFPFFLRGAVIGACECKNAVMNHEFMPQCPLHKLLGGWVEFCSNLFLLDLVRLLLWCITIWANKFQEKSFTPTQGPCG